MSAVAVWAWKHHATVVSSSVMQNLDTDLHIYDVRHKMRVYLYKPVANHLSHIHFAKTSWLPASHAEEKLRNSGVAIENSQVVGGKRLGPCTSLWQNCACIATDLFVPISPNIWEVGHASNPWYRDHRTVASSSSSSTGSKRRIDSE